MSVKKQLFEQLALVAQSLGSPQRIEILDYLAQAERGVDELSRLCGLTVANTSRHLQVLKQTGLVDVRKLGKSRLYKLSGIEVVKLVKSLRKTSESHLAEMDRLTSKLLSGSIKEQTISSKQLLEKINLKEVLLVDVRPEKEFHDGHIQGAINLQPEDIEEKIRTLPNNKTVVTYCRGPYCVYSYEMQNALVEKGFEALRLEDGFPEWKAAGLPYE